MPRAIRDRVDFFEPACQSFQHRLLFKKLLLPLDFYFVFLLFRQAVHSFVDLFYVVTKQLFFLAFNGAHVDEGCPAASAAWQGAAIRATEEAVAGLCMRVNWSTYCSASHQTACTLRVHS